MTQAQFLLKRIGEQERYIEEVSESDRKSDRKMLLIRSAREIQERFELDLMEVRRNCKHEWKDGYYGTECPHCEMFYAHGCAPWEDFTFLNQ